MQLGKLTFIPLVNNLHLVATPIQTRLSENPKIYEHTFVAAIDPTIADTASFCKTYDIQESISANCIIVEAKRADKIWHAACLILATDMIDVNGKVRRFLDARKISFAPKDTALALTDMEYGGITPLGLPEGLPILIDNHVITHERVVIGGGLRSSKILIPTEVLTGLGSAITADIAK